MAGEQRRVCVTGGSGFIASLLIKQLLLKGYAVSTTVRDPGNLQKVGHLKQLQSLGTLDLFRADLMEEGSFDAAVSGCVYVFLVAAPINIAADDPENEMIKPTVQGTLNVMRSCEKARETVECVVLTSSAAAVSMNQREGSGIVMDEEDWSDVAYLSSEKPLAWSYAVAKVAAEKEARKFAEEKKMRLVTVIATLNLGRAVAAKTISMSLPMGIALLSGNEEHIDGLRRMQPLLGSISIAHAEDTCRAHVFLAENESASGRYICSSVDTTLPELASFLARRYPQYKVPTDFCELPEKPKVILSSEKLIKLGFEYKHKSLEDIYDDTVEYARVAGLIPERSQLSSAIR